MYFTSGDCWVSIGSCVEWFGFISARLELASLVSQNAPLFLVLVFDSKRESSVALSIIRHIAF